MSVTKDGAEVDSVTLADKALLFGRKVNANSPPLFRRRHCPRRWPPSPLPHSPTCDYRRMHTYVSR